MQAAVGRSLFVCTRSPGQVRVFFPVSHSWGWTARAQVHERQRRTRVAAERCISPTAGSMRCVHSGPPSTRTLVERVSARRRPSASLPAQGGNRRQAHSPLIIFVRSCQSIRLQELRDNQRPCVWPCEFHPQP